MEARDKVRMYRCANYLTQSQLADKAGLTTPTVLAIEKGKSISRKSKEKLAEAMGIGVEELA